MRWRNPIMVEPVAVLLDVDNILVTSRNTNGPQLSEIVSALRERFRPMQTLVMFATAGLGGRDNELRQLADSSNAELVLISRQSAGKNAIDLQIAMRAMKEIQRVHHLVLVSGDAYFIPVLNEARHAGLTTTLITRAERTAAGLALAADERIDVRDFVIPEAPLEGLVPPGGAKTATRAIMQRFKMAHREITIIDPYLDVETIRLLAWVEKPIRLTLVSMNIPEKALIEVQSLRQAGRTIRLIRNRQAHDRWFVIDGRWWHSGGSLKQLGERWTRISAIESREEISAHNRMLDSLLNSGTDVQL
jgi:uncharacterized LabA/DUF88 family protein